MVHGAIQKHGPAADQACCIGGRALFAKSSPISRCRLAAIACRPPPTPVIHANHPDFAIAVSARGIPLQLPQDGVVADRHAEPFHQALARTAAGTVAEQADNLHDPCRPARIRSSDHRQPVGECSSCAFPICTLPAAQQELHCHLLALDWQILEAAAGPAMLTSASPSTIGAKCRSRTRLRKQPNRHRQ